MANNISNYSDNTVVSGSSGNDYIPSWGSNVKIYSGAGNDSICTFSMSLIPSNYVTIVGGKGNDNIDISRSSYNKFSTRMVMAMILSSDMELATQFKLRPAHTPSQQLAMM